MAANKPLDVQAGFSGGWNVTSELDSPEDTYQFASNMRVLPDSGELVTRGSTRRTTDAAIAGGVAPILGGYSWRRSDGTIQELISVNGHLYTAALIQTSSVSFGFFGLTDRGAGLGTGNFEVPTFAHFKDGTGTECVYIADNTIFQKLSKWNGTTFSAHTIGPNVNFAACWVANGRLFAVTGGDQILYYSALNNGDTLGDATQGGGFLTIRAFGASRLIGGAAIGRSLLLCHADGMSLYRGTTADDITVDIGAFGVAAGIGLVAPQSIGVFDNYAFLVTNEGGYIATEGGILPLDTPARPDPLIRQSFYPIPRVIPGGLTRQWFIARNPRFQELWFFANNAAYPPHVYNYELGRWIGKMAVTVPGVGGCVTCGWDTIDSEGAKMLLLGGSDGYVRAVDGAPGLANPPNRDDILRDGTAGSAFTWSATLRRFWGGRKVTSKVWRALNIQAKLAGSAHGVDVAVTGQGGEVVSGNFKQPTTVVNADYPVYRYTGMPKSSQCLDVTLSGDSAPQVQLASVEVEGDLGVDRGV